MNFLSIYILFFSIISYNNFIRYFLLFFRITYCTNLYYSISSVSTITSHLNDIFTHEHEKLSSLCLGNLPQTFALRRATLPTRAHMRSTCEAHTLTHRHTDSSRTRPPTGGGCGAHLFESVKRAALHIVGHTSRQVRTSFSALGAIGRNGWLSVSWTHEASSSCLAPTNAERRESFESESEF